MLATGAPNRDGHIATITLIKIGHNTADKFPQSFIEDDTPLFAIKELFDQRILTGQMAQCFVPIGVGDCPGIENEVSVGWHPSLKGEGLYHDREPISLFYDACCDRSYMTIAIGCTGGQHRSVYLADKIHADLQKIFPHALIRHRDLKTAETP